MLVFFILFLIICFGLCGFIYYKSRDEFNKLLGVLPEEPQEDEPLHLRSDMIEPNLSDTQNSSPDKDKGNIVGSIAETDIINMQQIENETIASDEDIANSQEKKNILSDFVAKLSFWKKETVLDNQDEDIASDTNNVLTSHSDEDRQTYPDNISLQRTLGLSVEEEGTASLKLEPEQTAQSLNEENDYNNNTGIMSSTGFSQGTTPEAANDIQELTKMQISAEAPQVADEKLGSSNGNGEDLQERYARLESLFNEKSTELNSTKQQLENELKNRQEFEKIKELLEKEIDALKEKVRSLRDELDKANAKQDEHENNTAKLEEKNVEPKSPAEDAE